jgi:hypothetical protein
MRSGLVNRPAKADRPGNIVERLQLLYKIAAKWISVPGFSGTKVVYYSGTAITIIAEDELPALKVLTAMPGSGGNS